MLTMMSILLGGLFDRSICGNDPLGQFLRPGMISERDYAQNCSIFGVGSGAGENKDWRFDSDDSDDGGDGDGDDVDGDGKALCCIVMAVAADLSVT